MALVAAELDDEDEIEGELQPRRTAVGRRFRRPKPRRLEQARKPSHG
jgi:hypothetical protein